jgi:hypothetical protein
LVASCGDSGSSVASDGGSATPCANANGCGGCTSLPASAGTACDTKGATWTCSGIDSLTCAHAPAPPRDVSATSDVIAHVRVTWQPPLEGEPSGYVIRRDSFEIAKVDASTRAFDDVSVEPSKIGVPVDLVATQGTRTDGVALTWSIQDQPKKSHAYEVVAVYGALLSTPAGPALGARRAPPTSSYELSRDNGVTWHPAGSSTTYLDVEAPLGSISAGTATTQTDYPRSLVHLEVTGMPTSIAPPPSSYRVRGFDNATPTVPSPSASGFRGVSRPSFQWQRSADDADGAFADAPGVTGSIWFDDGAPLDGAGRYYRAIMTAAGAAPATTSAARGARWGFKQIALKGDDNTCALRLDGALVCWGYRASQSLPAGAFAQLSRANTNNYPGPDCLLSAAGDLTCFDGSGWPQLTGPFKRVAIGRSNTMCGIDLADHVQCITGSFPDPSRPTSAEMFGEIAAGDDLVCGIRTDGKLWCWSQSGYGAPIPTGPSVDSYLAVSVAPDGYQRSVCAIREDHKLVCLGADHNGGVPVGVSAMSYVAVSTGGFSTCALRESDGKMECWGAAGAAMPPSPSAEPFVGVSVSASTVAGLRADGTAAIWEQGARAYDRPNLDRFLQVAIGDFSCGVRPGGELTCWGRRAPSTAWAGSSVRHVAIVKGAVCVLRSNGSLACADASGMQPTPAGTFEQMTGRYDHGCALRSDRKVVCWGDNNYGQAPAGPSLDTFKTIDVAPMNTCGVRSDDTVVCWGSYPLKAPSDAFLDVSVGGTYACGRRLDKKIVCWGSVVLGPTAAPYERVFAGNGDVLALDANGALERLGGIKGTGVPWPDAFDDVAFSQSNDGCALRRDGHLFCWGQPGAAVP